MTAGGPNREDLKDRRTATWIMVLIAATVLAAGALLLLLIGPAVTVQLEPGVGLREAALISFGVTLVLIIVMALAAGDSLLGELQYMLAGFSGFFLVLWVLIAWIF